MDKFRRVEIKYIIDENTYKKLKVMLKPYIKSDVYPKSKICNIYFDNDDYDLINNSINKPIYKEKIRLRSYNIPKSKDKVYLEIKKKYNGIVGKRRVETTLDNINNYIDNNKPINNSVNFKEIDTVIKRYDLKPKIFVAYDREAYIGIDNKELRITFDKDLRYRCLDLDLSLGDSGKLYFDKPMYIVEIKTLGAIPIFLSLILSDLSIYPTSFSKIGSIYLKMKGMINND